MCMPVWGWEFRASTTSTDPPGEQREPLPAQGLADLLPMRIRADGAARIDGLTKIHGDLLKTKGVRRAERQHGSLRR